VVAPRAEVALALHLHCYQPPREEPATGRVPRQPSAAPFHDWNERVAAECYRPNAFARIIGEDGRVVAIVNNYQHVSFNVGPTLLSWLEVHEPATYGRIIAADRTHHNALAQAYNHMILPLANERDVRTQVRWGQADFRHRFGREPEGMWLPETAVNDDVLRVLCEEGVRFTILGPDQVVADAIDTRVPYRWVHPAGDGRGIDIVVYDGPLSQAVAFDPDAVTSEELVARALAAAPDGGLVCVAADGETFGHHRKWVDRALAYALTVEAPRRGIRVTSVAEYLRTHRPEREVEIRESAWSCAHGVGRWSRDCGCSTGGGPDEQQAWRGPLRAVLDLARDFGVEVFERRGAEVFADPWAARDAYVDVVIGRTTLDEFAAAHVTGDRTEALILLEAQHQALLMYTSCGWFFHDLAGIETIQVLRHAHRQLELLAGLGEPVPTERVLAELAHGRSNDPEEGDGRQVWMTHVEPAAARIRRDELEAAATARANDIAAHAAGDVEPHLAELRALVEAGGTIPRGLWRAVDDAGQRRVDAAVARAVAERDGPSAETAVAVIAEARVLSAAVDVEPAQEAVYELLVGGATALVPLGEALGLAVDELGPPR